MNATERWKRDGYLVYHGIFDASEIETLRSTCDASLDQWRRESTPEGEPGGYCHKPDAWIMLHLNHPRYHHHHPDGLAALLNTVADPRVLSTLDDVFREPAVITQINYYIDPSETRPANWHRDCQFFAQRTGVDEGELIQREGDPPRELHMHIPLASTRASEVVSGSHLRTDTAEENRIRNEDPHSDSMPNARHLSLEPGDAAFFHVNALHRGSYPAGVLRRTIAVTFNRATNPRPATAETMEQRAGYVPSYQPWFKQPGYLDGCSASARKFYERFIGVYEDSWSPRYLDIAHPSLREYFTHS